LLRHLSWACYHHHTSPSSSLHRSVGADTVCIYKEGPRLLAGLTRDHDPVTFTFSAGPYTIFRDVICRRLGRLWRRRRTGRTGASVSTHRCCPQRIQNIMLRSALGLHVYYGLFLACLLVVVVAFWHIHKGFQARRLAEGVLCISPSARMARS